MTTTVGLSVTTCDGVRLVAELELRRDPVTEGVELVRIAGFSCDDPELAPWYELADFGPLAAELEAEVRAAFEGSYYAIREAFEQTQAEEAQTWML
jgi:hypothetical protein